MPLSNIKQLNKDYSFFNYPIFRLPEDKNFSPPLEKRTVLVLIEQNDYHEESQTLLRNILRAIQVHLDTQTHLLLQQEHVLRHWQHYPAELILSFGVSLKTIGLQYRVPTYQLLTYQQQSFLCVDKLTTLAEQKSLKAALWQNLKMFSTQL